MDELNNPYAAPAAGLEPPPPPLPGAYRYNELDRLKASRGARLGAHLLDAFIVIICFAPFLLAAVIASDMDRNSAATGVLLLLGVLVMLGLVILNLVLLYKDGQTLAKRWLGICIVRSDGSRCDFGRMLGLRILVPGLINVIVGVFSLIDACFIFGDEKRCLHDLMADTIVINV